MSHRCCKECGGEYSLITMDYEHTSTCSHNHAKTDSERTLGSRLNNGKPELSYVPQGLVEGCARAMMFGAKKYARNNWRKGLKDSECMDSLLRHAFKYMNGEEMDDESGECHLDHIAANIGFLLEQRRLREIGVEIGEENLLVK